VRTFSAAQLVELSQYTVRPFFACEIQFTDQMLRIWTGLGTIALDMGAGAHDYLGIGDLGTISSISETLAPQANGVQMSLSGIPSNRIIEALSYCRQGMPVTLYLGFLSNTNAVIGTPLLIYAGMMDEVSIDEGADTSTITIKLECHLIDQNRTKIRRYTDNDQQLTAPGDHGFEYVPLVQNWNHAWGGG
jgi:hypothetical protein